MPGSVLLEIRDGVARITLHRPECGNALDLDMAADLNAALDEVGASKAVRAVLLCGSGKAFCVGGDIAAMGKASDLPQLIDQLVSALHGAVRKLMDLQVPVLAALNGAVGGGGIGLALCADLVLAAESAKLRGGYSAIGLTPDGGGAWFLTRRVGEARAKEILFLNRPLDAAQCLEWGIVNAVYPDAHLEREAQECARQLAASAALSLGRIKQLVDGAAQRGVAQHLELEHAYMVASAATRDAREGVAAFLEKRKARFSGG